MTGPGSGDASRMRIAGIVLLAVAGVAAVVGLLALGGEGPSTTNASAPGPSSVAPLPGAGGVTPPSTPPGPAPAGAPNGAGAPGALPPAGPLPAGPGGPPAGAPAAGAPIVVPDSGGGGAGAAGAGAAGAGGQGAGAGGGSAGGAPSNAAVPVRVFNNSTITGLADRAAAQMRAQGWNVVEVGNYPQGVIPTSTVYYRPGTGEQAAAESAARDFGIRSEPRFDGIQGASPGLIVIATNNWGRNAS